MKKIIAVILIIALFVPAACSADSLDSARTRYNVKASFWGAPELPEKYTESAYGKDTYFFFMLDKITIAFTGSKDDIHMGHVFYDEGANVSSFLYACMAMADTIISSIRSIDLGGFILTGFTLCKKGDSPVPYSVSGYATMEKQEDQIIFSCMDY